MLINKLSAISRASAFVCTAQALGVAGVLGIALAGCTSPAMTAPTPDVAQYERAVSDPLRTEEDRATDASRKPVQFLQFAQVAPDMQVLDVAAGGGNTTRLLASAVGPRGKVYSQGPSARPAFEKRLAEFPQSNIVPVTRPYDDPMPAGAPLLDLVTINLSYHDLANLPLDRVGMDRRLYAALKPGGHVVVIDHAARKDSGAADTKTLHRIDEALVRSEFQQAGFSLEQTSDYLRNPADAHERKSSDMERMTDRFALRFVKPATSAR